MAQVSVNVDSYKIYYKSGGVGSSHPIMIYCYNGPALVAQLAFTPDSEPLGKNLLVPPIGNIYLRYHVSQFPHIHSILRNESPLFVLLDTHDGVGYLATTDTEPVGELEP
jgi:hypothetical protein